MFAQLGNTIFKGVFGWDDFSTQDATTYAQHDLIGAKPRLQAVGNDLEEINFTMTLRQEYVNVTGALLSLKASKDNYEVLPLLMGSGQYLGDYVITSFTKKITQTLSDGGIIEAVLDVSLKEFVTSDRIVQLQQQAKKQAFAVGDRSPVNTVKPQLPTIAKLAAIDVSKALSNYSVLNNRISEYQNNVSQQHSLAKSMQKDLGNIQDSVNAFEQKVTSIQAKVANATDMIAAVKSVVQSVSAFKFPITSIEDLKANNLLLAGSVSNFKITGTGLLNSVITRRI
jgi:phage protein U